MATALSSEQQKLNLEIYSLIWLDKSVGNSEDTIQAQKYLKKTINYIKLFRQVDQCEEYIQSISKTDRIILIVSGQLGREIVPRIHDFQQIYAIYVYCMNKKKNEQWTQPFYKIKRIIVNLQELIDKIRDDQIEREHNKIYESISFDIYQYPSTNNSFLYSYLLINCLLQTNSSLIDKTNLLSLCKEQYEDNENELKILEEFEQNYFPSRSLWWYTRSTCLYRILKKALDQQNIELLLFYRFFIRDIQRQLEKNQLTSTIHVYFGQLMTNDELDNLRTNIGQYILIHSFLLTSNKKQIQTYFSQINFSNAYQCVLFEIEANPHLDNIKLFNNITTQSFYSNDEQILFMLGSIFQLKHIQKEHNNIWMIKMKLCSENDQDLKLILNSIKIQDTISFGYAFCQLKKYDQTEKYYKYLLKCLPNDHDDTYLYYDALGNLEKQRENYNLSLQYFNQSLEIKMKIFQNNHSDIADSYIYIGEIFLKKKEFKQAYQLFEKAMTIYKQEFNNHHPKVGLCFYHMGHVYKKDKKYSRALDSYQKALQIYQNDPIDNNLVIADLYEHIGRTYEYLDKLDEALDNYKQALDIYEHSTSQLSLQIGKILKNIGKIYENKKQFYEASLYYKKALENFNSVLSQTDIYIIEIQQDIQRINSKLKQ